MAKVGLVLETRAILISGVVEISNMEIVGNIMPSSGLVCQTIVNGRPYLRLTVLILVLFTVFPGL